MSAKSWEQRLELQRRRGIHLNKGHLLLLLITMWEQMQGSQEIRLNKGTELKRLAEVGLLVVDYTEHGYKLTESGHQALDLAMEGANWGPDYKALAEDMVRDYGEGHKEALRVTLLKLDKLTARVEKLERTLKSARNGKQPGAGRVGEKVVPNCHDPYAEIEKSLPPVFARTEVARLLGNLISAVRLANIHAEKNGPPTIRIGRKVGYTRGAFVAWMRERWEIYNADTAASATLPARDGQTLTKTAEKAKST